MKHLNEFLINKKIKNKINQNTNILYSPNNKNELKNIIRELLSKNIVNLNCIDVSKITNFNYLFEEVSISKEQQESLDISEWNMSNAKYVPCMFRGCRWINPDLSNWDVSNIVNTHGMFIDCESFEGKGLENWNTVSFKDIGSMFVNCQNMNADLGNWNISNVTNIEYMFNSCYKFEGKGLENWDVSKVDSMKMTFYKCNNFNGNIGNWNVSNVTNLIDCFTDCHIFNQNLGKWNVNKMKTMKYAFKNCTIFEGNGLNRWKLPRIPHIDGMFQNCISLYVDLSSWNCSHIKATHLYVLDGCNKMHSNKDFYPKFNK